jgi:hypothetical protein
MISDRHKLFFFSTDISMGKYGIACCGLAVLIVCIVILLVVTSEGLSTAAPQQWVGPAIVALEAGQTPDLKKKLELENTGFFNGCSNPDGIFSCQLDCDDKFAYAVSEFGGPGLTYSDYVKSQAIDPQIIENQAKFVADTKRNPSGNMTGRVYSPDRHTSYDPIAWVGFRRPQGVAVCNPTQVPDLDLTLYETTPTFTWKSS